MPGPVRVATQADAAPLAASLARAFFDDPVMSFLIPHEPSRRRRIAEYFEVALTVQHLPHGGCYTDTDRAGGALWDPPDQWKLRFGQIVRASPKMIAAFGLHVPRALRVLSTIERQHPRTPHWYLAVLGTDPIHQGKGIGSALLAPSSTAAIARASGPTSSPPRRATSPSTAATASRSPGRSSSPAARRCGPCGAIPDRPTTPDRRSPWPSALRPARGDGVEEGATATRSWGSARRRRAR